MNSIKSYTAVLLILTALFSCRELYYPETDSFDDILVVDGLITDQPGMSYISILYQELTPVRNLLPLRSATVYLSDDDGDVYPFTISGEKYYPPSGFRGIEGQSYVLHIETENGDIYRSEPQQIVPAAKLDALHPHRTTREFLYEDMQGNPVRRSIRGTNVYSDLTGMEGTILRFRTEVTMLLLYNYYHFRIPDVDVYYRWKKLSLNDEPGINIHRFDGDYETVSGHSLCFLPAEKTHYGLNPEEYMHRKILIIRYYTLNNEAYRFHREAHRQMTSENKLFDPVVSQLPSNITCITDPGRLAVGFFEASSTRSETHMLVDQSYDNIFNFIRIEDLEHIPPRGSMLNVKPAFWKD
ncbi:MAG: DUF4249 domain-containing protein [Marinilabiliales bacterium]|nr:MAG: DUF4249 domain-containing protein [Marinilabiliales bacterium]